MEQFANTVQHFMQNGHQWQRQDCQILFKRLPRMNSFNRLTEWLLDTPRIRSRALGEDQFG